MQICKNYIDGEWNYRYFGYRYQIYAVEDMVHAGSHSLNYNDLLNSSSYTKPYYAITDNCWMNSLRGEEFYIGSKVPCLCCNKNIITETDKFLCEECNSEYYEDSTAYEYCSYCDVGLSFDETIWIQDEPVCSLCAEKHAFYCEDCQDWYFYDSTGHEVFSNECGVITICEHCIRHRKEEE